MSKTKSKVLFTARHELIDPYIEALAKNNEVYFFHPHIRAEKKLLSAHAVIVKYKTLLLGKVFRLLKLERVIPVYISSFQKVVGEIGPNTVVTLDFFRLIFFQTISYQKRHPSTKLFVYSETQQWPSSSISKWGMKVLFKYMKKNAHNIEMIIVWTERGEQFYKKYLPAARVEVLPAPVDTTFFVSDEEKYFYAGSVLKILCNARYSKYKRHEDLFAAVAKLTADGYDVSVTCIGRADVGQERVIALASRMGIEKNVEFKVSVPRVELMAVYKAHDVLVLPSINEAIGMVVPEAMACGIPTVTSDTVGANVYVKNGETGFIFKTGDVDSLHQCLLKMMNQNTLKKMGAEARNHVETHFNNKILQEKFVQIFSHE